MQPDDHACVGNQHDIVLVRNGADTCHAARLLRNAVSEHTLAAAVLYVVLVKLGLFPVAVFRHDEQPRPFPHHACANHAVAVVKTDCAHTARRTAHYAGVRFVKADGHAVCRADNQVAAAICQLDTNHLVALVKPDCPEAVFPVRIVVGQGAALDNPVFRHKGQVLVVRKFAQRNRRADLLARRKLEQVDNRRALCLPAGLRHLITLELKHLALIRKEQDVVVRRSRHNILDKILIAHRLRRYAAPAAPLAAVGVDRHTLDIAQVRQRNDNFFFLNQILNVDFVDNGRNLTAALVAVFILNAEQVFLDHFDHEVVVAENLIQMLDERLHLRQIVVNLLPLQAAQPSKAHIHNRLCLYIRQAKPLHEFYLRVSNAALCAADDVDDLVNIVDRNAQSMQNMLAVNCLFQVKTRPAQEHILLKLDIIVENLPQVQQARFLLIDKRDHVCAEALLHLREFVKLV